MTPPELDVGFRFELTCRCRRCEWSMPIDELKAKGGSVVRSASVLGVSMMDVETPEDACPRCGGRVFAIRFKV